MVYVYGWASISARQGGTYTVQTAAMSVTNRLMAFFIVLIDSYLVRWLTRPILRPSLRSIEITKTTCGGPIGEAL